ncbi:MAG: hypothetical protein LH618_07205, partial [Saprospiraceae bacterium]|nr:hypothetical protein [Saprospiraceae bacterium]
MALNQTLAALQQNLYALIVEDLDAALLHLEKRLPDHTEKKNEVISLRGRLNDTNQKRHRNLISNEEFQREKDHVRSDFLQLVKGLEKSDFKKVAVQKSQQGGKQAPKTGTVLYHVPHRMILNIATKCVVRVALDKNLLWEGIVDNEEMQVRERVQVSNLMEAKLHDPSGGARFFISSPNPSQQLFSEWDFTEWIFFVTPLCPGTYDLCVIVSMVADVPGAGLKQHDVTLSETVEIVTGLPAPPEERPMKSTNIFFSLPAMGTNAKNPLSAFGRWLNAASLPAMGTNAKNPLSAFGRWLNTATNRVASLVVLSTLAVMVMTFWPPSLRDWIQPGPCGPATRNVRIFVHAPDDRVAKAAWVDDKEITMLPVRPGMWAVSAKVTINDIVQFYFQVDLSGKNSWPIQRIGEQINFYVPRLRSDTSCGVEVKVDTIIHPIERWR